MPASFYQSIKDLDIFGAVHDRMTRDHWYLDADTGRYKPQGTALDITAPWIYTVLDDAMQCGFYLTVFDVGNFIAKRCMGCWKICASPRTVDELFRIYALQTEVMVPSRWPCKCGMDIREYTPHRYGAYWYCTSKDQGLDRWKKIRKMLDERVSPDIPLILKRYCTEFELRLGPTDKYVRPADADAIEDAMMATISYKESMVSKPQPEGLRRHIMRKWLERAWSIGDMTCMAYNNNEPFYRPLVTYHHEADGGKK